MASTPPAVIEGDQAVREALESALVDEELEGVALFGHGRPYAVLGTDGREALNPANVRLIGARWAHAMACLTGIELGLHVFAQQLVDRMVVGGRLA